MNLKKELQFVAKLVQVTTGMNYPCLSHTKLNTRLPTFLLGLKAHLMNPNQM